MKLKKLEITGFKSFYDKAGITFPQGVSAVVGPNGCGKSNIIDALRWVMGEQSVKQLRGKKMEDVIFSGANGKPPLNMAEVSLTLANDNGDSPEELKDFTEINLTRRLYRSGESAYFLNKQPCRLKDIYNVFWGSGLGSKSYAIIQQGRIGAITDASPEELRFFIEEAAGVTRYKNRKTEALRKIDVTKNNLLRVTDIILEIKRQMASLKRQARKAEIYNNYRIQIKAFETFLSLHYYDDYARRIQESDSLLCELQDLDISHTTEIKKLDATVEEIKLKRWQKNQEISEQKSNQYETQRSIDRIENDRLHLRGEVKRLSEEASELNAIRADLEEKNREMLSEIEQVKRETAEVKEEIATKKSRINEEKKASEDIAEKLAALNRDQESDKSRLMDLIAREAQYKNIYQTTINNKESLQKRLAGIEEEENQARKKIKVAQKQEETARKQLATIKDDIQGLEEQIASAGGQLTQKNNALGKQVKLTQTLELERNTVKSNFNTLKKMADNFEWYRDGVKAIMKPGISDASTISSTISNKIVGLMADIIEAKPTFEAAVEAVLGDALQYIIVQDQDAGLEAIHYLQAHQAGRSGFIPLSAMKPAENLQTDAPVSGSLLIDQITVKPGYEAIVRTLLGHVVFTDGIEEAIQLYNRNGTSKTIVTKNGDVISPQGFLIGGSKDKLNGILAKKQELKALNRQSIELDQKLEDARSDQSRLESEARQLEIQLQKLTEQKNNAVKKEIEAEKELVRASEELKNAERHLEIVMLEKEKLQGEASDVDVEMTKYNSALMELSAEVQTAQNKVSHLSASINTVSAELEQYQQKLVDLQLQITALNAKLENANNSLRRLSEYHNDSLNRLEKLGQEIRTKQQKQESAKQQITAYDQKLSEMYKKMEALDQALKANEAHYESIDGELQDSDNKISKIKSEREHILEKVRLLELEQSERKIKKENVASRLEEKYRTSFAAIREGFNQDSKAHKLTEGKTIEQIEAALETVQRKIDRIVDVNLGAIKEYEQLKDRFDFLKEQRDDLEHAIEDLHRVIKKINAITQKRFLETFDLINEKLKQVFPKLFGGGQAKLILKEPHLPLDTGVEFMIHPPGKKLTRLSLLSGGEKALAAIAFIFSIFLIRPAAFCLLDEIDAPLDDANVYRFNDLLKIIGENSQIIMITHNKRSMEFADTLFGITMEEKGISKIVSVNFETAQSAN
ncbi:MAG: chromosome segregation protein SMC [Deltaproteobacteria bacterium]|jgi:chromosome segregation protein|nr:chromosome segregation protein SMC [Deltaproteobacteria bacterium]